MSGLVPGPGAGAAAITVMSVSMICSAIKYTGYQDTHTRQIWRTSTEMKRVAGLGCRFNSFPMNSKYSGAIENRHTYYLSGSHVSQDIGGGEAPLLPTGPGNPGIEQWHRHHFISSIFSGFEYNIFRFFKYWNSDLSWKIFVSSLSAAHSDGLSTVFVTSPNLPIGRVSTNSTTHKIGCVMRLWCHGAAWIVTLTNQPSMC